MQYSLVVQNWASRMIEQDKMIGQSKQVNKIMVWSHNNYGEYQLSYKISISLFNLQQNINPRRMSSNYDYLNSPIKVAVTAFKQNKTEKDAVYFTVEVHSKDNKWYMEKRFSEFDNLLKGLKLAYHDLPNLPTKSFLFKMKDKDLQERKQGLEDFLRKVVVRDDLMNSDLVKSFLQLDKNASDIVLNPPKLQFEYNIEGKSKGIRDYVFIESEQIFLVGTADMSPASRLNAKVTNTKLPWENDGGKFMEVGSIQAWQTEESSSKFVRKWSKGYPKEVLCISFDPVSKRIVVGLEDGVIDVLIMTQSGYEDVVCVKTHKDKVQNVSYDSLSNCVYSASRDKVFRVSHGSSLALIVGIPHKEELMCMFRDIQNKRVFLGTKSGQVHIYDISQAQKPKLITVLNNNKKGAIRSLHLDNNRNYLFTGSFDDGQLNVFDLDKPGRQKLAKCNATLMGKQKVRAITWSAKRAEIMSGHADGSITFWNAVEGKPIYVLKAFDNQITKLEYIPEKDMIIASSKGKQIKQYKLPKEWRDARLVADEQKLASKLVTEYNKQKVSNAVQKAAQDSDDDDLAGWHLD